MNATAGMRWRPPSPGGSKIPNLTQPQQHCGDQGYANKHDFMFAVYRQHKPKGTQLSQTGVIATLRLLFARQAKGKRKLVKSGFCNNSLESYDAERFA